MSAFVSCAVLGVLLCFMSEPEQQARSLFVQAEQFERAGKVEEAYVLYQQVHLVSPTSTHGQQAMERIHLIETEYRSTSRQLTIPLGTVEAHIH